MCTASGSSDLSPLYYCSSLLLLHTLYYCSSDLSPLYYCSSLLGLAPLYDCSSGLAALLSSQISLLSTSQGLLSTTTTHSPECLSTPPQVKQISLLSTAPPLYCYYTLSSLSEITLDSVKRIPPFSAFSFLVSSIFKLQVKASSKDAVFSLI
jgi:hypothetical protein